jgi:hypothetical protein
MAAVLAYRPEGVLSHRSAAALWGLLQDNRATIDITVPARSIRSRPGIHAHMSTTLDAEDIAVVYGIPCTSLARVLVDLAGQTGPDALKRAIGQADLRGLFDRGAVHATLDRANGRRGVGVLGGVLAELAETGGPTSLTESELEECFLNLCEAAGLPRPDAAVWLTLADGSAIKLDFLWRRERVAVECDGYRFHRDRQAFERDRARDARLASMGITTLRFTWRQLTREPDRVIALVAAVLDRRAA